MLQHDKNNHFESDLLASRQAITIVGGFFVCCWVISWVVTSVA